MKIGCIALVFALVAVGCGDTTPASTDTTPSTVTVTFSGALAVQGSNFLSVTVGETGEIEVTLASLTNASMLGTTSPPVTAVMAIGVGVTSSDGLSCAVTTSVDAAPGLTAQLVTTVPTGTTCVQISDMGNLLAPANFVIRIVHT